ncbi:CD209 antigen-like protein E isoform X1 [Acipenser oxyrinchus oxyrinchus]|uniref:CD209 antigen-like protein E isoform X1 n=1 Tax=Acipenser oxyrinchus oxyrinchus TaxID=40147 RepID=A0AAD8D471_ACIOX|nr:CD209 antigen-like protein E isoform X1 [Acipenser oxyrinchus oxyrinchus]
MSGDVLYSSVKFSQKKKGKRAGDGTSTGKEDDVTYTAVKFGEAPSRQQQQADSSSTADPTAGKAPPYRWAALVLAVLCALSVAANIFLSVHYIGSLDQLKTEIQNLSRNYSDLQGSFNNLNAQQSECMAQNNRLQSQCSEWEQKYSALVQCCPVTDTASKKRVCCPEKWVQFNGKWYNFSTDAMDWNSSRARCVSMGADLVIIENKAEQEFIQSQTRRIRDFFWIGLSDEVTEGEFLWVDNTPVNITYWKDKEPDNKATVNSKVHSKADCAVIDYKAASLQSWGDTLCSLPVRRVCKTISAIPAG